MFKHISTQRRNRAEALLLEIQSDHGSAPLQTSETGSHSLLAVVFAYCCLAFFCVAAVIPFFSTAGTFPKIDQTKAELDELVAFECLYCGDIMINSVRQKFLDPVADAEQIHSWAL